MPDSQCSTPATPKDDKSPLKRSLEQYCKMERPSLMEAHKRKKIDRFSSTNQQPRWHNQAYMLFLALRQHSEKTMARTDLIKSALAIDKRISEERLVPKVFRGKTPMNSASAILTNNSDRYFIPFKPDGSKSMHFRLSFEPGSFEGALKEYNEWQEKLVKNDWPYCFGVKKEVMVENIVKELDVIQTYPTEFDEFIANRKRARQEREREKENTNTAAAAAAENIDNNNNKEWMTLPKNSLDQLDVSHVPQAWQDIVSLKKSTATQNDSYNNNNNFYGLFANRNLPKNTPLGFYFGVPMSEDEFDSMKDGIGQAADYSFMYRKTVIDPTDENGRLYYHNGGPLCPFHYIKETSIREKVNVAFFEGDNVNQIICWTKRDILPGEELFSYGSSYNMPSPPVTAKATPVVAPQVAAAVTHSVAHPVLPPVSSLVSATTASPSVTLPPVSHFTPIQPHPPAISTTPNQNTSSNGNGEYWQKKPSISSMLNTTIPIL